MEEELQDNLKQVSTWKRIGFILIFAVIAGVVRTLIWVVVLLQIASALLTGNTNPHILGFGQKLAAYLYHIMLFMTFNTDTVPFPFSDWGLTEEAINNRDLVAKK
ncbi:lipase [Methylococcaceae bacterium HT4]|nr:lipase [Methylococcaceae bacterium HT4]TXL20609.1 lipase [Methylococcaceae bacterium HT5]